MVAGLIWGAGLAAGGCARVPTPSPRDDASAIVRMLEESADEWNRGNLDGFLATYLDSPQTTFVTGTGLVHGKGAIRDRYLAGYWKSGGLPPQLLRFEDLQVRPLGATHALATGRYVLTQREGGAPAGKGIFSLVLVRTGGGWKIIHDHSSASPG